MYKISTVSIIKIIFVATEFAILKRICEVHKNLDVGCHTVCFAFHAKIATRINEDRKIMRRTEENRWIWLSKAL